MYITASSVQQRKNLEVIVFVGASISNGFISSIWIIASCFGLDLDYFIISRIH